MSAKWNVLFPVFLLKWGSISGTTESFEGVGGARFNATSSTSLNVTSVAECCVACSNIDVTCNGVNFRTSRNVNGGKDKVEYQCELLEDGLDNNDKLLVTRDWSFYKMTGKIIWRIIVLIEKK